MYLYDNFLYQVKCEKYWPDESEIYGDIEVTITDTRTFADYVTRSFILKKVMLNFRETEITNKLKKTSFQSK